MSYRFKNVPMTKYPIARRDEGQVRTNRGKRLLTIMGECIEAGGSVTMRVDRDDDHREMASGEFDWHKGIAK